MMLPRRSLLLSSGVFLLTLSVYVAVAPGRIDMIDGQYRFEVAHNLLAHGTTEIHDKALGGTIVTSDGRRHSPYSVVSSLLALPLVGAARVMEPESLEREHFFFSMTSPVLAAATVALLLLFYLALDVPRKAALAWTLVFAFATSMLPAATTVFDQVQHGFFILAAAFLLFMAAQRAALGPAIAAGLMMGIAVSLKEIYIALVPALALITLPLCGCTADARRRALIRSAAFVVVGATTLVVWVAINVLRFSDPLAAVNASGSHPSVLGNPIVGLLGLVVSPGKGLLLYSPAIVLAVCGLRQLLRDQRRLGQAVLAASAIHLTGMASLSFFAGDWCWGPRYLVPVLPLVALGFPLMRPANSVERRLIPTLVAGSLVIQLLGISLDHHRFFYARSLHPFFWYGDSGFYFRESALLARTSEVWESITAGVPVEAEAFRPGPYPGLLTYAVFGTAFIDPPPSAWMRHYRVFWLPRPWPLWMEDISPEKRPVSRESWLLALLVMACGGTLEIRGGLRVDEAGDQVRREAARA